MATSDKTCGWCRRGLPTTNTRARFCRRKCRQSAFRLRKRHAAAGATLSPGSFIYADPPYPGTSAKYYRDEPTFGGEVDFPALILSLTTRRDRGECLGWALSTSARSLRDVLPLCPREARVCAWVKPIGVSPRTYGLHNTWEPLIVCGGRQRRPGKRDWLRAMPARGEGTLPGRKPIAFCAWLFELLGMQPGDTLIDVYPGTGIVARAWTELSSGAVATASLGSAATLDLQESATASFTAAARPSLVDEATPVGVSDSVAQADGATALSSTAGGRRRSRPGVDDVAQVPGRLSPLEETTASVVQAGVSDS